MKKIFKFAFVIFIFVQVASAENFPQNANALLSFNVNGMQKNHRLETNPKWADTITKIISESGADIVCLQEVCIDLEKRRDTALFKNPKKNNVLDYFTKHLSEEKKCEWRAVTSARYLLRANVQKNGKDFSYGDKTQNNAILYDAGKFSARDLASDLGFENFSGEFLFHKNSVQVLLFENIETSEQFIVINVHLPFSNSAKNNDDLETLKRLTKHFEKFPLVVAGDFNISREILLKKKFFAVDGKTGNFSSSEFAIATTLSRSEKNFRFANDYDHFVFNEKVIEKKSLTRLGLASSKNILKKAKLAGKYFYSSNEFVAEISDHFPIIFWFQVK